ncbi:glycosyl transferase family protein [Natrinema versiforme JCM 10478]|uniref:Glycosyl transferase family protein n=2 Tax=Natrinema versiforme TaxID=88724 RepID=L9XPY2_9EURY|nr:glycosyl transferase family protein [Natrinema versiforme JCM 10478]
MLYELTKRGIDTEVILARKDGGFKSDIPDDTTLVTLDSPDPTKYTLLPTSPYLAKHLEKTNTGKLLSFMTHANITSLVAAKIAKQDIKLVIGERNHLSRKLDREPCYRATPIKFLIQNLYPKSDHIITTSNGVADDLKGYLKRETSIDTIYNPVVTDDLISKSRMNVDHVWFKSDDTPVILAAGRLHPQKDFRTLIRAFNRVVDKRDARLLILGEGPERERLESLISELEIESLVELPGSVNNPFRYMANASVFVLSSKWEGFGNVIVEAMACGCPVVATDCPSGPAEILENGEYGELVPVKRPDLLSGAIEKTLDNDNNKDRIRDRANDFTVQEITDQYLEVLELV